MPRVEIFADGGVDRWIANRVIEILGSEDDVVIELIFDLVEGGRHVSTSERTLPKTSRLQHES